MGSIVGTIVDPLQRRVFSGRTVWEDGRILAVEPVAQERGPFIVPGFVDAHVHVESSMLPPAEFARLAMVHGTTGSVSDPHEIANVLGSDGVEFMLSDAASSPFRFCFGAPSCVPATAFETAGAVLDAKAVAALLDDPRIGYLAEVMNFPGVLARDADLMQKIAAAQRLGKPVDGHAPGLRGEDVRQYAAAGITTDHEASSFNEAAEKIAAGMKILIREGSAARNFDALVPLFASHPDRLMFCSDDKHPDALLEGHINRLVARAVELGFEVIDVLFAACVHPVLHYRLPGGLLRVGDPADFVVVEDLKDFRVLETWIAGECVARDGASLLPPRRSACPNRFHPRFVGAADFVIQGQGRVARVIEVEDGQLITRCAYCDASALENAGVLRLAVVNRYSDAPPALAFVRNCGRIRGALASTVAHDSHNIVAIGSDEAALAHVVNLLMEARGGCAAFDGERSMVLPLPIAGLMSPEPGPVVAADYAEITRMARRMGATLEAPFMTLSFLALLVIPELKLSDRGLFDGRVFEFVPLFE